VAIFKASSADDLTILRAGMCPDCGAGVNRTMTACKACGLSFDNNLADLPAPKGPAAAPAQAAPPPQAAPQPQYSAPPQPQYSAPPQPQYSAPPGAPTAPASAAQSAQPGRGAPPPSATPDDPTAWGRPLTAEDIDALERGPLRDSVMPLTDAEGPDVTNGDPAPLLGSSLSRAAIVVMADAAIVDDPMVLLGYPVEPSHVARAMINLRRGDAALIDDPEVLIASRDVATPEAGGPRRGPSQDAVAPEPNKAPAPAPSGGVFAGPGVGKPLTLEDIERLERPYELEQPHSFAEVTDLEGGVGDPLLGAALIRGATAAMAEAAVVDDPLVLLGYPPVIPRDVARSMINLKRGDAATTDDVESLLIRPAPTAAAPVAPAAPAAPARVAAPAAPVGRPPDPEATALIDQNAVRAAQAAVLQEEQRQQQLQQQNPNRVASVIHGRGGAKSLD